MLNYLFQSKRVSSVALKLEEYNSKLKEIEEEFLTDMEVNPRKKNFLFHNQNVISVMKDFTIESVLNPKSYGGIQKCANVLLRLNYKLSPR